MATKAPEKSIEVTIIQMTKTSLTVPVLGLSPLICNRMSEKVKRELLAPKGRKTAVDKASSMKHDPMQEYRDSPYRMKEQDAPTLLAVLPAMFKQGMCTAAMRVGAKKTEIEQLVSVGWDRTPVYGVPRLFMSVTRSADINKTPDVRTRALLREWACFLTISFMQPVLRESTIINLLAAAGQVCGIGDWRQQKGSGSYGLYTLTSPDDPEFRRIVESGGRDAQLAAMESPECHDDETEDLLAWYDVEVKRRGFKVAA
jgi:hypothetical protein